jgi:glycosyltransferase involved in cell wall biosynthesis
MIRVGFMLTRASDGWLGGLNYVRNLLHAIVSVQDRRIEPVLILSPNIAENALVGFPKIEVIRTSMVAPRDPLRLAGKASERLFGRNLVTERLLRAHGIVLLSHDVPLGARSRIPTISWIPDFQHRRLPEMFSSAEIERRDRDQLRLVAQAATILLSSYDAQRDFAKMAPTAAGSSRVLHFVSGFGDFPNLAEKATLVKKYQIDGPFFYLPNQFWKHKNHAVVIDALAILRSMGRPALVMASGPTSDYRNPDFFQALMQRAEDRGVTRDFRVLGVVPYDDVKSLMQHAIAIINPSRFEGWSTTVEESKSIGKQILLSDIPVHREQAPERGVYFPVDDPKALAVAIDKIASTFSVSEEVRCQAAARERLPALFEAFGREYESIVLETLARN